MQKMFLIICALAVDLSLQKAILSKVMVPNLLNALNYPDTKKKAELTPALLKGVNGE